MKSAKDWLSELAKAGFGHPVACCCDRCKNGHETFLLESDIADIQKDAMEITPNEATIEPDTIIDAITYAVLEVVSPEGYEPEDKAQIREAIAKAIDKSTTP